MKRRRITDNLSDLLGVLPPEITRKLQEIGRSDELLEVILDLGRVPTARYTDGEITLIEIDVTQDDIDYVVSHIGEFDADNRGGLERTLHRISAIRNRHGKIVGLTCRVGRAVFGTIEIIQEENLLENVREMGTYFLAGLRDLQQRYPAIFNPRGLGLMLAFSVETEEWRNQILHRALQKGLLLIGCGFESIRFLPPLNVNKREIDLALEILDKVLSEVIA